MGEEATSAHRYDGMVGIMGINYHPLFVYQELVDSVRWSLFSTSAFLL